VEVLDKRTSTVSW